MQPLPALRTGRMPVAPGLLRLRRRGSRWGRQPGLPVTVRSGLLMQPLQG